MIPSTMLDPFEEDKDLFSSNGPFGEEENPFIVE